MPIMFDFNGSFNTNNDKKSPNRLSRLLILGSGYIQGFRAQYAVRTKTLDNQTQKWKVDRSSLARLFKVFVCTARTVLIRTHWLGVYAWLHEPHVDVVNQCQQKGNVPESARVSRKRILMIFGRISSSFAFFPRRLITSLSYFSLHFFEVFLLTVRSTMSLSPETLKRMTSETLEAMKITPDDAAGIDTARKQKDVIVTAFLESKYVKGVLPQSCLDVLGWLSQRELEEGVEALKVSLARHKWPSKKVATMAEILILAWKQCTLLRYGKNLAFYRIAHRRGALAIRRIKHSYAGYCRPQRYDNIAW